MKKKHLSILLVIIFILSLTSCIKEEIQITTENNFSLTTELQPTNKASNFPSYKISNRQGSAPVQKLTEIAPIITPSPQTDPSNNNVDNKNPENLSFRYGDNDERLKDIQERLNKFGYTLTLDGAFGPATLEAVINFQYRLGLRADGIINPATLEKLNSKPTPATMYDPEMSVPTFNINIKTSIESFLNTRGYSSNTQFFLWIDLKNQRVHVFSGYSGNWLLIKSMVCATGKASTPTVKGLFSTKDKGDMFRAGSNTICKYWTRFYNGYLFHTILLDNDGNIKDPTLGQPASHGCIRLSIEDAKFIYYNLPYDTAVWSN